MPYYQSYTYTTSNQYLIDLAAFAAANGWTIDLDVVYLTSWRRLHIHKGAAHYEFRSSTATVYNVSGCTGYGGTSPTTAPGYCGAERTIVSVVGQEYAFVSTQNALYFQNAQILSSWGCLFTIVDKVGSYTEGFGFIGAGAGLLFGTVACTTSTGGAQVFYNGAWSTAAANTVPGGALVGIVTSTMPIPTINQPNMYNAGLTPCPVLLMIAYTLDASKRIPLGFAPGYFLSNPGSIYSIWDEIIIGADTYLFANQSNEAFKNTAYGAILFKLGA